jgi:hypothetical protein
MEQTGTPGALGSNVGFGAWLPIATAPKNKELLLWVAIAIGPPLIVQGCWYKVDSRDKGWIDTDGRVQPATHWMPMPAPPREA